MLRELWATISTQPGPGWRGRIWILEAQDVTRLGSDAQVLLHLTGPPACRARTPGVCDPRVEQSRTLLRPLVAPPVEHARHRCASDNLRLPARVSRRSGSLFRGRRSPIRVPCGPRLLAAVATNNDQTKPSSSVWLMDLEYGVETLNVVESLDGVLFNPRPVEEEDVPAFEHAMVSLTNQVGYRSRQPTRKLQRKTRPPRTSIVARCTIGLSQCAQRGSCLGKASAGCSQASAQLAQQDVSAPWIASTTGSMISTPQCTQAPVLRARGRIAFGSVGDAWTTRKGFHNS